MVINHLTQNLMGPFYLQRQQAPSLPIRYSAHAGARIMANDFFNIVPNVLYRRQGNVDEKMAGAYLEINAKKNRCGCWELNYGRLSRRIITFS